MASGGNPQMIFEHDRACLAAVRRRQELVTENLDGSPPASSLLRAFVVHSFISYRLAAVQNTAQVALEAGKSPQMILRHYRDKNVRAPEKSEMRTAGFWPYQRARDLLRLAPPGPPSQHLEEILSGVHRIARRPDSR